MRFFSLPDTNSVRQFLLKIHFSDFSYFWMTTFKKKNYFYRVFWPFPFCLFFFFLFLFLQQKDKNKKCNFLFENLIFDIPKILQKHYFGTMWHYLCFQKYQKHYKIGESSGKKKLGPVFNFKLGAILTLNPPNLWPIFNFTASKYIYIYMDSSRQFLVIALPPSLVNLPKIVPK